MDENKLAKLEKALQLRNFEIELFWKRFNYFWLISAAALVGYVGVKDRTDGILLLVSCFGFVSSFCWTLLNIGSKWWHEAWEIKVQEYEEVLEKGFFGDHKVDEKRRIFIFPLRRFSVSAVAVGISFFFVLLWFALATWHVLRLSTHIGAWQFVVDCRYALAYIGSIGFCILIGFNSYRKSE